MAKYILVEKKTDKRIISIETNDLIIEAKELPKNYREGERWNDYLITISSVQDLVLEYNIADNKLYNYSVNQEKAKEQSDKHSNIVDEKGVDAVEGKYTHYLDQWEYILLHNWKNITEKILQLIQ